DAGSQHQTCTGCPSGSVDLVVRFAAPELGQMRSDVRIIQTALDRRPQERAARLIDATDNDHRTLQRCRDGRWVGNIDPTSADTVANCRCDLIRPRWVTASDYDAAWIIGREFGCDAPPNHSVATDDENSLRVHSAHLNSVSTCARSRRRSPCWRTSGPH